MLPVVFLLLKGDIVYIDKCEMMGDVPFLQVGRGNDPIYYW